MAAAIPCTLAVCLSVTPCVERIITPRVEERRSKWRKILTAVKSVQLKSAHALCWQGLWQSHTKEKHVMDHFFLGQRLYPSKLERACLR